MNEERISKYDFTGTGRALNDIGLTARHSASRNVAETAGTGDSIELRTDGDLSDGLDFMPVNGLEYIGLAGKRCREEVSPVA